jgi:polyhydroxybutyrate depolymerase
MNRSWATAFASLIAAGVLAGCAGRAATSVPQTAPTAPTAPTATGGSLSPSPGVQSPAPSGTASFTIEHDGVTRSYVLHVPASLDRTKAVPLLIELHGGGGSGETIDGTTGFYAIADREGFVVAAPSATGTNWNDGRVFISTETGGVDDVGFLSAMIDRIETQVEIDPGRVYVVGFSNGAIMTGRLACQLSERFAAVAQAAGTAAVLVASACHPGRVLPILEMHGTADTVVPYKGGTVAPQLGGRGQVLGVDDWASLWVANNSASPQPQTSTVGALTIRTWHGSSPASDVVFYRIEGGGHTWPAATGALGASETIWQFLSAHRSG